MRQHLQSLLSTVAFVLCAGTLAGPAGDVSCGRPPYNTALSHNYTNARTPLRQQHFIKLPVGSIRPAGWVGRYLQLQRDGLTGTLGEISAWLDKHNNAWLTKGATTDGRRCPSGSRAIATSLISLTTRPCSRKTKTWIEAILKSQREDGAFGPVNMRGDKPELWAQMIVPLSTPPDLIMKHSGNERVLKLMSDCFQMADDHSRREVS